MKLEQVVENGGKVRYPLQLEGCLPYHEPRVSSPQTSLTNPNSLDHHHRVQID